MAVPNTDTFSLQDVVNEVIPTTNDLVDCIADAVEAKYDPAYYTTPATSLLEFRNYGAVAWAVADIAYNTVSVDISTLLSLGSDPATATVWVDTGGTRIYTGHRLNQTICQLSMASAHDVTSTISLVGVSSAFGFAFTRFIIHPSGTYVYLANGSTIQQHAMSTAWDITTLSTTATNTKATPTLSFFGNLDFNSDGTKLYIGYDLSSTTYLAQCTLGTAYDLSTAGAWTSNNIESTNSSNPLGVSYIQEGGDDIILVIESATKAAYRNGFSLTELDSTDSSGIAYLVAKGTYDNLYTRVRGGVSPNYTWKIEQWLTNV